MKNRFIHLRSLGGKKPGWPDIILIVAFGVIIYANALTNSFVWDDELLITGNSSIRSLRNLPRIFTTELAPKIGGNFYRPLQTFSYAFDYFFWGMDPFGYHLTNVILHIGNAIIVYFILFMVTGRRNLSLLAALLFIVHPVQTEAVTYISGRADILAAFFMFASLLLFLLSTRCNYKSVGLYIASAIFYIFALLSKEATVIFPVLVILVGLSSRKKLNIALPGKPRFFVPLRMTKNEVIYYGIILIITVVYLSVRIVLALAPGEPLSSNPYPFSVRFLTSFKVVVLYLKLLILPVPLHMERVIPIETSLFTSTVFFPLLFLAGIAVGTIKAYRRKPILFFGIAWFFITLFPYLNWFPLNAEMSEHWLYLPSVGFFLLFALGVEALILSNGKKPLWEGFLSPIMIFKKRCKIAVENRSHSQTEGEAPGLKRKKAGFSRSVLSLLLFAILICFSVFTIDRNRDWKDNKTIYQATARSSPGSPRAHYNLGNLYLNKGEFQKAIEAFRRSIRIKPWDFKSHKSLGKALLGVGKIPEAIKEFETAVSLQPSSAEVRNELGVAYGMADLNRSAVRELKFAISLDPNSAQAHNNLASVYANLGQFRKALPECERALKLDPGLVEANFNLGVIYYHLEQTDRAKAQFEKVLKIKPDFNRAVIWRERIQNEEN